MSASRHQRRPIRILPPQVAARIAAGEVIERPASVVKELVENALDAGATRIRIDVRGAGLHEIRVSDDGCGIPPDELPLAVQRHATSKLPEDDLNRIETLGFRGEALPSIAAVAELTIASAASEGALGRRLVLRDGRVVGDEAVAHPPGTTVTVSRLFENVPARLASLRNERAEAVDIVRTVQRLALAAPHVRFSLYVDGRAALQTTGSGSFRTALLEIYGAAIVEALREIERFEVRDAEIVGLITIPDLTRADRNHLHVIVNGRWTQPRTLLARLEEAYRPYLPRGRHPIAVVVVRTPPQLVDVNVHPAKLEVRLRHERDIARALAERVQTVLARTPKTLSLQLRPRSEDPLLRAVSEPSAMYEPEPDAPIVTPAFPPLRLIGHGNDGLIVLEGPDGLYLVDQHRAHERILAERLLAQYRDRRDAPVLLPEPVIIDVRPAHVDRFQRWFSQLASLGFRCEPFGPRSFLLRAVPELPGLVGGTSLPDHLGEFGELAPALLDLAGEVDDANDADWLERFVIQLACRTAVRRRTVLARHAQRALVQALGETAAPAVCPHGSPIVLRLERQLLARQFRW